MSVETMDIVSHARDCIGTRFQHQGRLRGAGMDCVGLILYAGRQSGADLNNFVERPYKQRPNSEWKDLQSMLDKHLVKIWDRKESPTAIFRPFVKNGDVVLMSPKRYPTHLGILAVGRYGWNLIHVTSDSKRVCEHRLTGSWESMIHAVYRFRGVD